MKVAIRKHWNEFKSVPPGQRFQKRHARRHAADAAPRQWWHRGGIWLAGVVLLLIGAILCLIPGPGIPFLFFGGALLAGESRVLARGLDWMDVTIRKIVNWAKRVWRKMSIVPRVAIVLIALTCGIGVAYAGFRIFFDRA